MAPNEEEEHRRDYRPGYSSKHPIPTVQQYRSYKEDQRARLSDRADGGSAGENNGHEGDGLGRWFSSSTDEGQSPAKPKEEQPSLNKPAQASANDDGIQKEDHPDISQVEDGSNDPKTRRKQMKHRNVNAAEREVTDPVTHLPVTIRDFTDADLDKAGEQHEDSHQDDRRDSSDKQRREHDGMERVFPSPNFQIAKHELAMVQSRAITFALSFMTVIFVTVLVVGLIVWRPADSVETKQDGWFTQTTSSSGRRSGYGSLFVLFILGSALTSSSAAVVYFTQGWVQKRSKQVWDDALWETKRREDQKFNSAPEPESTIWLNKILGSIWPLVNPDLFVSLVDTLEDVMQASLPALVRMVSVEDLGQGSEPLRVLGVKWLPRGAAAKTVDEDGKEATSKTTAADDEEEVELQAEEGEFTNVEIAFAYRACNDVRKKKDRTKNAHLYMAFYMPGGIRFPVWVELEGFVGTIRARLQLTPDPPFIALCTLTFMGQPKVDIACSPLVKRGLDIMDIPLISNFVQSAVDAAVNEYVAPKSLTLDLKAMLSGDDFKHDTVAFGILIVCIDHAFDFKASDMSIPLIRKGSSDPYVSVGWAKFGKPLYSTRVLVNEMEPSWAEVAYLPVGPEELDAEESLRLQLWDSDRTTADDDLGRIEVPVKELMENGQSRGKMWERSDPFEALKAGERKLKWRVGYYPKVKLLDSQVAHKAEGGITTVEQLREQSHEKSSNKLRESNHDTSAEAKQVIRDDFEETCTEMISTSVPSNIFPSGILSIVIHQVTGLQVASKSRERAPDGGEPEEGENEDDDDLPDAYCVIVINHQKIFKTRTKPKNSKPFFNAGTERFIRDWRNTNIMVAVRDSRVHEDHPLLGLVYIDLGELLRERRTSRVNHFFPLAGGIGYGRMRISLVFRSVDLQPPTRELGWDWGTIEIAPKIKTDANLPSDLRHCRLKARTPLGKGSFWPSRSKNQEDEHFAFQSRKKRHVHLAVRSRYKSCVVFEFRSSRLLLPDQSSAFAVLWLQDIPDEEELHLTLPVFRGNLARAEVNVLSEDQMGDKVGTLQVTLRFLRGLSSWHSKLAKKNTDIANVMEDLVCARDENLLKGGLVGDSDWLAARSGDNDDDDDDNDNDDDQSGNSTEGSDDGSDDEATEVEAFKGASDQSKANEENASAEKNSGGILNELKSYNRHQDQLHRRHRGIMQWKGPRTIKWMKNKAENTITSITNKFEHSERQPGVETEI